MLCCVVFRPERTCLWSAPSLVYLINKDKEDRVPACSLGFSLSNIKPTAARIDKMKQEDLLRFYSLVSAIVCLFVLIIVLKFVGNE